MKGKLTLSVFLNTYSWQTFGWKLQTSLWWCTPPLQCSSASTFKCSTHISKSNQQPMDRTKSPAYTFLFSDNPLQSDICHNIEEKNLLLLLFHNGVLIFLISTDFIRKWLKVSKLWLNNIDTKPQHILLFSSLAQHLSDWQGPLSRLQHWLH